MKIDTPNITATSPELQAIKGWAADLSYKLTQSLTEMEAEIESLREEVNKLKEESGNGV